MADKPDFETTRAKLARLLSEGKFMLADMLAAEHGYRWDDLLVREEPKPKKNKRMNV